MAFHHISKNMPVPTHGTTKKGVSYKRWSPVQECKKTCPAYDICTYKEKRGKCSLEVSYLRTTVDALLDEKNGLGDQLNEIEMSIVGLDLTQQYHTLIRLKKIMLSLEDNDLFHDTPFGPKPHAVLSEIRSTHLHIRKIIQDLNLIKRWENKFGSTKPFPAGKSSDTGEPVESWQ